MSPGERRRREPPRFRRVEVRRRAYRTPHLAEVVLGGDELIGFSVEQPAASVRLLLPEDGELAMPAWDGNVFLRPDGERATIRTFTPLRVAGDELTLEIVIHDGGAASAWVEQIDIAAPAAISGPGRGYEIDPEASGYLLAGDETAIPAIGQLLGEIPTDQTVQVLIEVRYPDARVELPAHPHADVDWLDLPKGRAPGGALVAAVVASEIEAGTRVWAAGEAAAMQQIRHHLQERGLPRSETTVRGYWKLRT